MRQSLVIKLKENCMQFVYIDESGTGNEPVSVMAGVIADSYRMRPTKADWNDLLRQLSQIVGREIY